MWRNWPGYSWDDPGHPSDADPRGRRTCRLPKGDRRPRGDIKSLDLDPFSGYLFVFRSRSGTSIKVVSYDGQGYWCCQKRLSKGRFRFWPDGGTTARLAADELQALLWNKDPGKAPLWRSLT